MKQLNSKRVAACRVLIGESLHLCIRLSCSLCRCAASSRRLARKYSRTYYTPRLSLYCTCPHHCAYTGNRQASFNVLSLFALAIAMHKLPPRVCIDMKACTYDSQWLALSDLCIIDGLLLVARTFCRHLLALQPCWRYFSTKAVCCLVVIV